LARIIRCEEKLDLHSEQIAELNKFKNEFPDIMVAKVIEVVSEIRKDLEQLSNPSSGFFEIKDLSGETRKIAGVLPAEWNKILQLAVARENILMVGPTGCGKTFVAEKIAEALNLPFYSISCCEGMSENELKGWLLPVGENGSWVYVPSDFVKAYETGGVFNLDEMDASDANVLTWLNKAIGGTSFHLAMRKENSLVKRHKDFVLVACANTMGSGADMIYVGRNQLDGATRDRFKVGIISMDYSPQVEAALIDPDVLDWGRYIRKAMHQLQDRTHSMSTRTLLSLSNMRKHGWVNKDWESAYFADWAESDKTRLRNVVKDLITADLTKELQKSKKGSN
jgi:hypothetical protein